MTKDILSLYKDAARFDAIAAAVSDDLEWWRETFSGPNLDLLDLGCGSGRVTLALAAQGHRLCGIDNAPAMLERAKAKDIQQQCRWLSGDIRQLADLPSASFDGVLIANNTLSHLLSAEDLMAVLQGSWRCLRPAGRLVIDTFAPSPELCSDGEEELLSYRDPHSDEEITLIESHRFDAQSSLLEVLWYHQRSDGVKPATGEAMTLRLWYADELIAAAAQLGFQQVQVAGDYDGEEYASDSPLILFSARRP